MGSKISSKIARIELVSNEEDDDCEDTLKIDYNDSSDTFRIVISEEEEERREHTSIVISGDALTGLLEWVSDLAHQRILKMML